MTNPRDMTDRRAAALAELADLCLQSARDLAARQLAAETAESAAALADALHKVGRSLRQSLALEARLRRDQLAGERQEEAHAQTAEAQRRTRRRSQVEKAVERLIWAEAEDDDAVDLADQLSDLLDEDMLAEDFGQDPLDIHITRTAQRLGLKPWLPLQSGGRPAERGRTAGGGAGEPHPPRQDPPP